MWWNVDYGMFVMREFKVWMNSRKFYGNIWRVFWIMVICCFIDNFDSFYVCVIIVVSIMYGMCVFI